MMFYVLLHRFANTNLTLRLNVIRNYSSIIISKPIFKGELDRYNGITIDSMKETFTEKTFKHILDDSLRSWSSEGRGCVWFKVNIKNAFLVPALAEKGFNFHHAREDFVMMYKWLPKNKESNLPPPCHTSVGVGAMVFNKKDEILAICEKHYEYPHWKLPGGYVEKGEDIIEAAVREVKEETGVEAGFQSLVTFRHTHNMMFGNSDIYILLMMEALSDTILLSQREVKDCVWMKVEDYTNHPHVHEFNRLVVKKAIEYENKNIKLDIQKRTVKWSQFVRDMSFLVIEDFKERTKN